MGRRRQERDDNRDLLAGTLDMLILQIVRGGPVHGLQIAQQIEQQSGHTLLVEQGSLYPALRRLEDRGWLTARWGISDTSRRARFYSITPSGRDQLRAETDRWELLTKAVTRVMKPARVKG